MSLNQTEIDYLASQPLGRLATLRPDGTLQNNPVGCHYNPATGTIDITGYNLAASQKFRNVAANDQIAFVVDDIISTQPWRVRCLEIRGTGETIETQQPTETAPPQQRTNRGAWRRSHPNPPPTHHQLRPRQPRRRPSPSRTQQAEHHRRLKGLETATGERHKTLLGGGNRFG